MVGKTDDVTGQAIFAFVTLRRARTPSDALGVQLREHVAYVIGPIARPKFLLFTPDLPKTRSGQDHAPAPARHRRGADAGRHDARSPTRPSWTRSASNTGQAED